MTWNHRYRIKSYLRSSLWIVPVAGDLPDPRPIAHATASPKRLNDEQRDFHYSANSMKTNLLFLLTLVAWTSLASAGAPSKVNKGTIHARTFNFVTTSSKPTPSYVDNSAAVHAMIQKAITRNLAARGVTRVNAGGDVTVPYLVITGDNASTTAIAEYFGYGDDLEDLHNRAQKAYTRSKNPNYFEAGTLLIDIVDGKNFKLMKRGYATRPSLRNLSASAKAARIQEVVDEILRDVRIGP